GYMARQFAGLMAWALERIDDWLSNQRDSRRFRMRDKEPRTLQTLFGVDITFRRRRYVDRETGKTVYLLEEVLQLPAHRQVSPALASWALGQRCWPTATGERPGAWRLCTATRW